MARVGELVSHWFTLFSLAPRVLSLLGILSLVFAITLIAERLRRLWR